jgi:hypothetical protein
MLGPPLERVCDTNPTKNNIVSTVRMEVQKMLLVLQLNWPKKVIGYWPKKVIGQKIVSTVRIQQVIGSYFLFVHNRDKKR